MSAYSVATKPLLRAEHVSKVYPSLSPSASSLEVFRDVSLSLSSGEMVAIVGESGSGKSSLLHILAALDTPTSGEVHCNTIDVARLTGRAAANFRNRQIGFVWQFHYLLPEFTALENVAMPLLVQGMTHREALARARRWLEQVGLESRGHNRSGELSGGEQQRVSIARALVTEPKLLLADEPTGDLDHITAERIFALLQSLQREHHLAVVLVTHNPDFARRCDRMLRLCNGQLRPS